MHRHTVTLYILINSKQCYLISQADNDEQKLVIYCMLLSWQGSLCVRQARDVRRLELGACKFTHRIFSSCVPFVISTSAANKSLKLMPLLVPPQARNSQSAMFDGVPSHRTSCTNAFLFSKLPFAPADRLKASLIRRHSASDTKNHKFLLLIEAKHLCF